MLLSHQLVRQPRPTRPKPSSPLGNATMTIDYQATALLPNSLQSGCISKLLPVKVPTAGPH